MSAPTSVNLAGSVCLNDANFTIFIAEPFLEDPSPLATFGLTQDQAIENCQSFAEDSFTLGPIQDRFEFDTVRSIIQQSKVVFPVDRLLNDHQLGFFVGLEAGNGQEVGGGNTSAFTFVDPSANLEFLDFYHVQFGTSPWGPGEPNNLNEEQSCGHMFFSNNLETGITRNGVMDDASCDSSSGFICRGPCLSFEENNDDRDDFRNEVVGGMVGFGIALLVSLCLMLERKKKLINVKNEQLFLFDVHLAQGL